MKRKKIPYLLINIISVLLTTGGDLLAQAPAGHAEQGADDWGMTLALLAAGLAMVGLLLKMRSGQNAADRTVPASPAIKQQAKPERKSSTVRPLRDPQRQEIRKAKVDFELPDLPARPVAKPRIGVDARAAAASTTIPTAQILEYSRLPVNSFTGLKPAALFGELPTSDDSGLFSAIDQSLDENDHDVEVRLLAMRVLAAFKTYESMDALSQIALYDLSVHLRSKAVSILADLDHESVFETIVLACSDPTREVRAAASRAIVKLSFDRADAWVRIVESGDQSRICQAAAAAVEAGLTKMSFERLAHRDERIAYEAFTMAVLLVRGGEAAVLFEGVWNHRDPKVRLALMQVLKAADDESIRPQLEALIAAGSLPEELIEKAKEILRKFDRAAIVYTQPEAFSQGAVLHYD